MIINKRIFIYIDLAFCLVFMPVIIMLIPVEQWLIHNKVFFILLMIYLFGVYYTNRHFNIPALLLEHKFAKAITLLGIMILMTYMLTLLPYPDDPDIPKALTQELRMSIRARMVWTIFLVISGFCFCTGLLIEFFKQQIATQEIEAAKNRAELALYKAQINPHFLFNTLNTLYGLLITHSDKAESVFIKFSDILKYMYSNANRDTISIGEEVEYIRQYIELQELRLNEHTQVIFDHSTDDENAEIPPMMLITFVENAFKYGSSSCAQSTISIILNVKHGVMTFATRNDKVGKNKNSGDGIGIDNCRKRLELLYPDKYKLDISDSDHHFELLLTIQL